MTWRYRKERVGFDDLAFERALGEHYGEDAPKLSSEGWALSRPSHLGGRFLGWLFRAPGWRRWVMFGMAHGKIVCLGDRSSQQKCVSHLRCQGNQEKKTA